MKKLINIALFAIFSIIIIGFNYMDFDITSNLKSENDQWEYLFNGKDLEDWKIKIRGYKLGYNFNNTFKVKDGTIKVSYENYDSFDDRFGHIFFTKKKYKNYHLSLEYKFSGVHLKGAPGWSIKNSGIMLHCQNPETMLIEQDFPISAEVQLLGGLGKDKRPTANICTPGTDVDIDSTIAKSHCINSTSKTYHHDDWVKVEVIVFSNKIIHHVIDNDTVLSYTNIRIGGNKVPNNFLDKIGMPLKDGYISLQSEGHPVEFRNIKIKTLLD
jgi:hypothetical protein|tara:strand:+ start:923 stop:1732 length:810 start_codon:yes stop_codon:yes gene_type:complete